MSWVLINFKLSCGISKASPLGINLQLALPCQVPCMQCQRIEKRRILKLCIFFLLYEQWWLSAFLIPASFTVFLVKLVTELCRPTQLIELAMTRHVRNDWSSYQKQQQNHQCWRRRRSMRNEPISRMCIMRRSQLPKSFFIRFCDLCFQLHHMVLFILWSSCIIWLILRIRPYTIVWSS